MIFSAQSGEQDALLVSGDTVTIGWIGPLTGDAAAVGTDSAKMAQLSVDAVNAQGGIDGKMLHLIVEDDKYSTEKSIGAYEKLVRVDGVKIILMQTYGSLFALSDRAERDGVVLVGVLDSNDNLANLGKHVFSLGVESESISKMLSGYANTQGFKKAGILYFESDTFFPYIKDLFVSLFDGASVAEGYVAGLHDFRTPLLKMKDEGVDVFVCFGYDECGSAIYQARTLGIDTPLLMAGTIMSPALHELARGYAEGGVFTFWIASKDKEPARSVLERFKAKEGRMPFVDVFSLPAYDAVQATSSALSSSGDYSVNSFSRSLRNVRGLRGVTGAVNFSDDGTARIPFSLFRLEQGAPVPIR